MLTVMIVVASKGLLSIAPSCSFLIAITQRQQVAQILGRYVYVVTNVALIPTSSQTDACRVIAQTKGDGANGGGDSASSDDEKEGEGEDDIPSEVDNSDHPTRPSSNGGVEPLTEKDKDTIAEDVIGKKKVRWFAASWLGRKGLGLSGLGDASSSSASGNGNGNVSDVQSIKENEERSSSDQVLALLPRLIQYTKLLFASRNFFFAYDLDITRPVGTGEPLTCHIPLHKAVDPLV